VKGQNGPFTPGPANQPRFPRLSPFGVSREPQGQELLPTEAQPDEIEGSAGPDQEADQGEVAGIEEMVCRPTNSTPEEEARDEIAEDRPESVLFAAAIARLVGHAAMVDEFLTLDNWRSRRQARRRSGRWR